MRRIGFLLAGTAVLALPSVAHADSLSSAYLQTMTYIDFKAQNDPGVGSALATVNKTLNNATNPSQQPNTLAVTMDANAQVDGMVHAYTDNGQSFVNAQLNVNGWASLYQGGNRLLTYGAYPSFEGDAHYWVTPWTANQNYVLTYWFTDLSGSEFAYTQVGQPNPLQWNNTQNVPLDTSFTKSFDLGGGVSLALSAGVSGSAQLSTAASLDVNQGGQVNVDGHVTLTAQATAAVGYLKVFDLTMAFLDDSGTNGDKANAHAGAYLKPATDDAGNAAICAGYDAGYDIENAGQITMTLIGNSPQTLFAGFTPPPQSMKDSTCYDLVDHQIHKAKSLVGMRMVDPTAQLISPLSDEIDLPEGTSQYTWINTQGWANAKAVWFELGPLPQGVTATMSEPRSLTTDGANPFVDLTFTTSASAPQGTFPLTIKAHYGALTYTTTMNLNVTPPPPPGQTSPTCPKGKVWDDDTQSCVPSSSGGGGKCKGVCQ